MKDLIKLCLAITFVAIPVALMNYFLFQNLVVAAIITSMFYGKTALVVVGVIGAILLFTQVWAPIYLFKNLQRKTNE
jgi:hypothetical protein